MRPSLTRQIFTAALAVAVTFLFTQAPLAAGSATVQGRVVAEDGTTPLTGVVVRLVDTTSKAFYDSDPTGSDGEFRVTAATAGDYAVQAKNDDQVFLAAASHHIDAGENPSISLSLRETVRPAPAQTATQKDDEFPLWGKIAIGGGITILGLFLINEVTEDVEEPSSPF